MIGFVRRLAAVAGLALALALPANSAKAQSIADIEGKGKIAVGVLTGIPPYDTVDASGNTDGFLADLARAVAVRDGHGAPVTCAACGCRLTPSGEAWFHFNPLAGRDARGCRVSCADAAHDASGRAVSLAV